MPGIACLSCQAAHYLLCVCPRRHFAKSISCAELPSCMCRGLRSTDFPKMADVGTGPASGVPQFRVPFDPLGADSIRALCQLLNPEDEEGDNSQGPVESKTGSHLTPGDLGSRERKPRARPNIKVEAKVLRSLRSNWLPIRTQKSRHFSCSPRLPLQVGRPPDEIANKVPPDIHSTQGGHLTLLRTRTTL